jgi:transcriptional antiterminator RfaH
LRLAGFETYFPRLREWRRSHGRKIEVAAPLFPGYFFLTVEAQWHAARWSPGVVGLLMNGLVPARVADQIIDDLRKRERNGLIELPKRSGLKPGDRVKILRGPFADHFGLFASMRGHERVRILLQLLGSVTRVELARQDVEELHF